jgi:acyl-coenzyme A thioesterase PaaI-like protein
MTDHLFDTDTRVEAAGEHAYTAELTDRWNALGGVPNGGYLLAVALRALAADMPLPDPVVASATYLRPGAPGPARIETEVVRAGRRVATGEARLIQGDREIARLLATFADLGRADGRTEVLSAPPALPPPDEARDMMDGAQPLPGVNITERFEYRPAELPGWTQGSPNGTADLAFWLRFRDGRDPDPIALAAMVDCAAPGRARPRRAGVGDDRADRAHPRAAGARLARLPDADPARHRRLPRGGLRDLGLDRHAGRPVAPVRRTCGIGAARNPAGCGMRG